MWSPGDTLSVLSAVDTVLFEEECLRGDTVTYHEDVENSLIDRVVANKKVSCDRIDITEHLSF